MRIAVIEDDVYLRDEITDTFIKRGHSAIGITSFDDAEAELEQLAPELIVLDVNLPGRSGFEICRSVKACMSVPVLILTARDTLDDELTALGIGADDFLTKPCHPDRLVVRAEHLFRRYGRVKGLIQTGSLILDTDTYKLVYNEKMLVLPETEGKILRLLMENYPNAVSHRNIFFSVWGTEEFVDENILQVNITRLRKSLSEIEIGGIVETVRGYGYKLGDVK